MALTLTHSGQQPGTPAAPTHRASTHRSSTHRRVTLFAAMLLAALSLSGCQGISINSAQLRVIDASPDAGVIDSYQNSSALAYNLAFGTMTTYIPMAPGPYTLAAEKAGTRQTLVTGNETLAAGKQYTQIIGAGLANLHQTILLDQSTPAPAGQVALRVVNETTRAGAVDVYLVPMTEGSSKAMSASPLAFGLPASANTGYITMPEGTYAIDVVAAGTPLTSSTVTLLSGPQLEYASGAVRTIVLIDQETSAAPHATTTPGVQAIQGDDADAQ
ncbi:MAG: DUF4397 domain-containing protein [Acidobacteriaceae bacterium]